MSIGKYRKPLVIACALITCLAIVFVAGIPSKEALSYLKFTAQELSEMAGVPELKPAPPPSGGGATSPITKNFERRPKEEEFLFNIYNGLAALGIGAPVAQDYQQLWATLQKTDLSGALEQRFSKGSGGIVTDVGLVADEQGYDLVVKPDSSIAIKLLQLGKEFRFGVRQGFSECTITPIVRTTPEIPRVAGTNAQCILAQRVRAYAFANGMKVNDAALTSSGAWNLVGDYLDGLAAEGLIVYSLLPDQRAVEIRNNANSLGLAFLRTNLAIDVVSPFKTLSDELTSNRGRLNSTLRDSFFSLSNAGHYTVSRRHLEAVLTALRSEAQKVGGFTYDQAREFVLPKLGASRVTPDQRVVVTGGSQQSSIYGARSGFTCPIYAGNSTLGLSYYDPTDRPLNVVTPANNLVVQFTGYDNSGGIEDSLRELRELLLRGGGYEYVSYAGGGTIAEEQNFFCKMKDAGTLMLTAHGSQATMQWQCYSDISAGSVDCCERMKATAQALGLPGNDTFSCNTSIPPTRDVTYQVSSRSSGGLGCDYQQTLANGNRCVISVRNSIFNSFPEKKAAVFAHMCHGGGIQSDIGFGVLDFVTGTSDENWSTPLECDAKTLASDLSGQAQYCRQPGGDEHEPFSKDLCYGDSELINGNGEVRSIAGSREYRGVEFPGGSALECSNRFNSDGTKRYDVMNLLGDDETTVEFFPTVRNASRSGDQFEAYFSSMIDPVQSSVTVAFTGPGLNSPESDFGDIEGATSRGVKIEPHKVTIKFGNGNREWLSNDWELPPNDFKLRFERRQEEWPWYAEIKIKLVAPNGVRGVGNLEAEEKWLRPYPSAAGGDNNPPWKVFNGRVGTGGDEVIIRIPFTPPAICKLPFSTIDNNGQFFTQGYTISNAYNPGSCFDYWCKIGSDWAYSSTTGPSYRTATDSKCRDSANGEPYEEKLVLGDYIIGYQYAGSEQETKQCDADSYIPWTIWDRAIQIPMGSNSPARFTSHPDSRLITCENGASSGGSSSGGSSSGGSSSGGGSNGSGSNGGGSNGGGINPCDPGLGNSSSSSSSSSQIPGLVGKLKQGESSKSSISSKDNRRPCD